MRYYSPHWHLHEDTIPTESLRVIIYPGGQITILPDSWIQSFHVWSLKLANSCLIQIPRIQQNKFFMVTWILFLQQWSWETYPELAYSQL